MKADYDSLGWFFFFSFFLKIKAWRIGRKVKRRGILGIFKNNESEKTWVSVIWLESGEKDQ